MQEKPLNNRNCSDEALIALYRAELNRVLGDPREWTSYLPEIPQLITDPNDILRRGASDLNVGVVEAALDAGADPNERSPIDGTTALMRAVGNLYYQLDVAGAHVLKLLIGGGADPHLVDDMGNGLWHLLAKGCSSRGVPLPAIEMLDDAGLDINLRNNAGETALMIAVRGKKRSLVRELRNRGADASIEDNEECIPMDFARNKTMERLISG